MQHFLNTLIMMGFLAHVPSGGALILPPLVVWYSSLVIQRSHSPALKGVLRLTSRVCKTPVSPAFCYLRLRGRRGRVSGRVVDDSPGPLSSPCVDAVLRSAARLSSCRPFKGSTRLGGYRVALSMDHGENRSSSSPV